MRPTRAARLFLAALCLTLAVLYWVLPVLGFRHDPVMGCSAGRSITPFPTGAALQRIQLEAVPETSTDVVDRTATCTWPVNDGSTFTRTVHIADTKSAVGAALLTIGGVVSLVSAFRRPDHGAESSP